MAYPSHLAHLPRRQHRRGLLTRIASSLLTAACAGASLIALATWGAASLALLFASPAHAQPAPAPQRSSAPALALAPAPGPAPALADPTRPPGGSAVAPGGSTGTGSTSRSATPAGAPARPPAPPPPHLQGLHLPRAGHPSALIDGQLLQVGERLQGWTVQSIHADGVLLARSAPPANTARQTVPSASRTTPAPAAVAASSPAHTLWLSLLPPLAAASAVPRP